MKTRWIIVGSLLTLAALALIAVFGGVALAQRGADDPTPEPTVAADAPALHGAAHSRFNLVKGLWDEKPGHFDRHLLRMWHHTGDSHFDPFARIAEIIGISTDELWEALTDGQTLAEIAADNGMTRQELIDALLDEAEEHLEVIADLGSLDDEQVAFLHDWLVDGVELLVDHPLPVGEEWLELRFHDWGDLLGADDFDLPERLAETLGLTFEELVAAILDGQSLAEIAEANGVNPQEVADFLTAEAEGELDEAVAAGYLTEEQAQVLRGWVEDGVEKVMDNPLVFPNAVELAERLGRKIGSYFGEIDWQKWAEFDWSALIGQNPLFVAAETIGISRGELLEALSEGESLAEIAEARGIDPAAVVDAQTEAVADLLDDLAEQGLFPADKLGFVKGHLELGMQMFTDHSFPFAEHWDKMRDGWHPWDDEAESWLREWLDRCPCDDASGSE